MKNKVIAYVDDNAECQVCNGSLFAYDTFYDGSTRPAGQWAWMCRACWQGYGRGVGLGVGQEYDSKTREKIRG
jgi:hypothetical protein